MGFFDLFRPKWKHGNAEVRMEAVQALPNAETATLADIAKQDEDPRVRRLAIKKIDDPQLLQTLVSYQQDETTKKLILERIEDAVKSMLASRPSLEQSLQLLGWLQIPTMLLDMVLRSPYIEAQREALQRIHDDKMLAEVVKKTTHFSIRAKALESIQSQSVLRDLVLSTQDKEEIRNILDRIQDDQILADLVRQGNKFVRQISQRKRDHNPKKSVHAEIDVRSENRQDAMSRLCRLAEESVAISDFDIAVERWASIQQAWNALHIQDIPGGDQGLVKRFERVASQFETRKQSLLDRMRKEVALEQQEKARRILCEKMESMTPDQQSAIGDLDQQWKQWGPVPPSMDGLAIRFAQAHRQVRAPMVNAPRKEQTPASTPQQGDLSQAYQEHAQRIEVLCSSLADGIETLDGRQLSARLKAWEDVSQNTEVLPLPLRRSLQKRLQDIRDALKKRRFELKEAEEWKKWSSASMLEKLCQRAEALLKEPGSASFARDFKELREAWPAVQSLSGEDTIDLRKRFREAYKELRVLHQKAFEQSQQEREENLRKKEQLCVQAESLLALPAVVDAFKQMQGLDEQWKQIGPMPNKQAAAIVERFRTVRNQLFQRLRDFKKKQQGEYQQRIKQKEALCVKVESVAASNDWKKGAQLLKTLQEEWKKIGPIPKKQGDALWQRFRKGCDVFFEKRSAEIQQHKAGKQENLREKETLCQQLEQWIHSAEKPAAGPYEAMKTICTQWKQVGPLPSQAQSEILEQQFTRLCQQFVRKHQDAMTKEQRVELEKEWARFENRIQLPAGLLQPVGS